MVSERGASKSTVARKLAAVRAFYRHLLERGEVEANPAQLVSSPRRDAYLPRVLKPGEVGELLEQIPASSPLELRDRAMFELAYSAGLRAEELVNLDLESLDPDGEELRVEGKGGRVRVIPAGEPAWAAIESYLARGRPKLRDRARRARAAGLAHRPAPVDLRRPPPPAGGHAARGAPGGRLAAHPAPLVRHPSAGGRRGLARPFRSFSGTPRYPRPRPTLG